MLFFDMKFFFKRMFNKYFQKQCRMKDFTQENLENCGISDFIYYFAIWAPLLYDQLKI